MAGRWRPTGVATDAVVAEAEAWGAGRLRRRGGEAPGDAGEDVFVPGVVGWWPTGRLAWVGRCAVEAVLGATACDALLERVISAL